MIDDVAEVELGIRPESIPPDTMGIVLTIPDAPPVKFDQYATSVARWWNRMAKGTALESVPVAILPASIKVSVIKRDEV